MKPLLLDTEALIWWDDNSPRLGGNARAAIQNASDVFVSAASVWEIVIKEGLGQLRTARQPSAAVAESGFRELPVTFDHAQTVRELARHHADPFDRLILATAVAEGLSVVTSDEKFWQYDVELIDARR